VSERGKSWGSRFRSAPAYEYLILAAITAIAFALRFYKLGQWSFWIDEMWSVGNSLAVEASNVKYALASLSYGFSLLFFFLKPVLVYLGVSEWSARLLPALIGVASIPALYLIVKKVLDSSVAILTALLLALSSWHLFWSQNCRFYTLLLLLHNLALFAFYWGLERDQARYLVLAAAIWALALMTHATAILVVPIFVVYSLLLSVLPLEKPPGLHWRTLFLLLLPLPIYVLYEVYRAVSGSTLLISAIYHRSVHYASTTEFYSPYYVLRSLAGLVYYLGVPLTCLAVCGGIYLLAKKKRVGLFLLLSALVPLLVLLFPASPARFVFLSLPSWLILAAVAVRGLFAQTRKQGRVLAIGVLVLLLADLVAQNRLYYSDQKGNRWDWKGAFALVRERRAGGDLVVTTWPELGRHYLGEEVLPMHEIDRDYVLQSDKRIWFVDDGWSNPALLEWLAGSAKLVDVVGIYLPGKMYEIYVYLYEPP
jgi:4-amino-4-deoxy-L-arabinose transferase-like glycosyltransferase